MLKEQKENIGKLRTYVTAVNALLTGNANFDFLIKL